MLAETPGAHVLRGAAVQGRTAPVRPAGGGAARSPARASRRARRGRPAARPPRGAAARARRAGGDRRPRDALRGAARRARGDRRPPPRRARARRPAVERRGDARGAGRARRRAAAGRRRLPLRRPAAPASDPPPAPRPAARRPPRGARAAPARAAARPPSWCGARSAASRRRRSRAPIHDRTEGLPFFVEELATALRVSGAITPGRRGMELAGDGDVPLPDTVRDAVLVSTSELSGRGRKAAEVAAVAGESFGLAIVAALSSDDGVTELIDRGLVREQAPGTGAFRHALTREALYADLPWTCRRTLHRALAEALERAGAPSRDVAPHWLGAHAGERAREALLRAAADSRAVHAHCDAADAYRQALELWPEGGRRGPPRRRPAGLRRVLPARRRADRRRAGLARARRRRDRPPRGRHRPAPARRGAGAQGRPRAWRCRARMAAADAFEATGQPAEAAVERIAVANQRRLVGALRRGDRARPGGQARRRPRRAHRPAHPRARGRGHGARQARRPRRRAGDRPPRPRARARARPHHGRRRALPAPQRDALRLGRLPPRRGGARHRAGAVRGEPGPGHDRRLRVVHGLRAARARRVVARHAHVPRDDRRRHERLRRRGPARRDPRLRGPATRPRGACSPPRSPSRRATRTTT